jgi:hypothetical protein
MPNDGAGIEQSGNTLQTFGSEKDKNCRNCTILEQIFRYPVLHVASKTQINKPQIGPKPG